MGNHCSCSGERASRNWCGLALSRSTSNRLARLQANVQKYRSGEALSEPGSGMDEIGIVEQTFYETAVALPNEICPGYFTNLCGEVIYFQWLLPWQVPPEKEHWKQMPDQQLLPHKPWR